MFFSIEHTFKRALQREGIRVYKTDETSLQALIRRVRNSRDNPDWLDTYFLPDSNIQRGETIYINDSPYLLVMEDHRDSNTYQRFNAIRCNQTITLSKLEKAKEPNEFGEYLEALVPYFSSPAYLLTELQGLNKEAVGNLAGGYITVLMPAAPINLNTPVQIKSFNKKSAFVESEFKITSIDSTDVWQDKNKDLHGILRLQIKP